MLTISMVTSIVVLSLTIVVLIAVGYFAFRHWNNKIARLNEYRQNTSTFAQKRTAEITVKLCALISIAGWANLS